MTRRVIDNEAAASVVVGLLLTGWLASVIIRTLYRQPVEIGTEMGVAATAAGVLWVKITRSGRDET